MTIIQFFKPTLFKIILTITIVVCLVLFYHYNLQQTKALIGISFEEHYGPAYYQCCENNNPSEYDISYCQSENLYSNSKCEELNKELNQIKKYNDQQKIIKFILLIVSIFLSYLFSCIIELIYHKIRGRLDS